MIRLHNMNRIHTFIDVESGQFISLPKDETDKPPVNADINNNIDTFHSTGGEGTPSVPMPIVNIAEWNKTVCGKNIYKVGATGDYLNPNGFTFSISGNTISCVIGAGASALLVKKTHYENKVMYLSSTYAVATKRYIVRCFDANKTNISGTITAPTGWAYVVDYEGFYKGTDTVIDFTAFANVKYLQIGFVFVGTANLTGTISDIMLTVGNSLVGYVPYSETVYPYRMEDVDGVLHECGDLPNLTADSVNWNTRVLTKKLYKKVFNGTEAWVKYPLNTAQNVYFFEFVSDLPALKWQSSRCTHFKNINRAYDLTVDGFGKYSDNLYSPRKYFNVGNLYPTVTDFKAWLVAQNTAGTPVTINYELATPVTYQIKQYGETYGGVIWDKNEKPKSIQYHTNIFTDKNITMQCEVRKLGNRKMSEFYWVTENGDKIITEDGDYIMLEY